MTEKQRILLAIPTAGELNAVTAASAARFGARRNVNFVVAKGRPVDYVRNGLIRQFLAHDYSHLWFWDSDIEPPGDSLERLLALDVPIAVGCYPLAMEDGLHWALSNRGDDGHYRLIRDLASEDTPFEVDAGGAGCLLIRRDVFDSVPWPWFRWFEWQDGRQISEDIHFFMQCNKKGLRVTADPQVICNHFKQVNITNLMRLKMKSGKELQCG